MQTSDSRRLNSWKEIATFLGRAERTVKRWEAENGLPVHRPVGKAGARIYADTAELTDWLKASPSALAVARTPFRAAAAPVAARLRALPMWQWLAALAACCVIALLLVAGQLPRRRPTVAPAAHDPRAVELYREGVHDWNTRTPAGLVRAQDEFTQAIVHDPDYAEAYVGLANTYNLLREYTGMADAEAYPRAEAAARRAIALDPSLARAHSALGFVLFYWRWDAPAAEAEFRKAIALDPRDALTHHWFANILRCLRREPEALKEIETAQGLDPDSSAILADKANILDTFGHPEEARQILDQMVAVDPRFASPHSHLADFALRARDYPAFLAEYGALSALRNDTARIDLVKAAQAGWDRGGAPAMLAEMLKAQKALNARGVVPAYEVARTYALMDDRHNALVWMRRAIATHDPWIPNALTDPATTSIIDDPAFAFLRTAMAGGHAGRPVPAA